MTATLQQGLVEHAAIDRAFRDVLAAFKERRTADASTLCRILFDRLRAHLVAEDARLEELAATDPAEAEALRDDHRGFFATVDELTGAIEAGTIVADDVHAFKARFSLHEAREETGLYRWLRAASVEASAV
jgi:hypothetical protein